MPLPLVPLIAAGATVASSGINAASQGATNRKARAFARERYDIERRDSLLDWNMQNEYNSPTSQMKRLREAGLNPNLVYDNGAGASNAQPVRSTNTQSWNPKAPELDLGSAVSAGLGAYYDTQIKQAQIDNLKSQNTVLFQEALLKAAQVLGTSATTGKTKADTEMTQFELQQKQRLAEVSAQMMEQQLRKLQADTQYTLDSNERAAAMQAPNLQKAAEEVLLVRAQTAVSKVQKDHILAQIENVKKDSMLRQLDIELRRMGVNPNDPMYMRVLGRIVNGESFKSIKDGLKKMLSGDLKTGAAEAAPGILNMSLFPFGKPK